MATVIIEAQQNADTPYTYTLTGAQTFRPESAFAHFDGTGASGPFLACLTFKSIDGKIFSRTFPSTAIAAGGVADVSYAPFPGGLIQNAGGSGIQFDTLNVGGWLDIDTTGTGPSGEGVNVVATGNDATYSAAHTFINGTDSFDGAVTITGKANVVVTTTNGPRFLELTDDADSVVLSSDNALNLISGAGNFGNGVNIVSENVNGITLQLASAGATLEITDSNGQPILTVNEDGTSYLIKTGQAWVASL